MKTSELKERLRAVIDDWYKPADHDWRLVELRALLADIEREDVPKPTPEPVKDCGKCY